MMRSVSISEATTLSVVCKILYTLLAKLLSKEQMTVPPFACAVIPKISHPDCFIMRLNGREGLAEARFIISISFSDCVTFVNLNTAMDCGGE